MARAALLKRMDEAAFGGLDVWEFAMRSLLRPYGRLILRSVLLAHPWRSVAGLWAYGRRVRPARRNDVAPVGVDSLEAFQRELAGGDWLVGVGFCQKPLAPPCPSGRFNHRCWLLSQPDGAELPEACRDCDIREVAVHALPAGASLHIMTSAVDIARDVLLPAMRGGHPNRLLLSVCPFSIPPITLAMTICGLRGIVVAYGPGVCQDFATWIRADEGDKPEQTSLPPDARHRLLTLLDEVAAARASKGHPAPHSFKEAGNFYVPVL